MRIEPTNARNEMKAALFDIDPEKLWLDTSMSEAALIKLDPLNSDADAIRIAEESFGVVPLPESPEDSRQGDEEKFLRQIHAEMEAEHGARPTVAAFWSGIRASI